MSSIRDLKKKLSFLTLDQQYQLCLLLMLKMASQVLEERLEGDRSDWLEFLAVNVKANLLKTDQASIDEYLSTEKAKQEFVRIILSSPSPEVYTREVN